MTTCALLLQQGVSSNYLCTITAARSVLQLPVHYYHSKKNSPPVTSALLLPQGLSSNYMCTITASKLSSNYLCTITAARRNLLQLPVHFYCRKKNSPPITCALLLPQEGLSSNYLCTITIARRTLLQLFNYPTVEQNRPILGL